MGVLRSRFKDAIFISHVGILFPFTFGVGLAYYLYTDFAPADVPFLGFGLFMGISMSVTAFPVLARIIQERRLSRTRLGILAITTAAIDDITAWCILAIVIAIVKAGSLASALVTIALSVVYVLFMLFVLRPFMIRLGNIYSSRESVSRGIIALVFSTLLGSAWAPEIIGLHAFFGSFVAGFVMPPKLNFTKILVERTVKGGVGCVVWGEPGVGRRARRGAGCERSASAQLRRAQICAKRVRRQPPPMCQLALQ